MPTPLSKDSIKTIRDTIIKEIAHQKWNEKGCPANKDVEIWTEAENEYKKLYSVEFVREPRKSPISLTFSDGEVNLSEAADEDDFFFFVRKAIDSRCQPINHDFVQYYSLDEKSAVSVFKKEVLIPIFEWCKKRFDDKLECCYIAQKSGYISSVFILKNSRYDFEFAEETSELSRRFGWRLHPFDIPSHDDMSYDSLSAYFCVENSLKLCLK